MVCAQRDARLWVSTNATRGACPGSRASDGGYLDGSGQPVEVPPPCVSVTLQPSIFVTIAIVVVVLAAISRVLQRAHTEADALRMIGHARTIVIVVASVSIVSVMSGSG